MGLRVVGGGEPGQAGGEGSGTNTLDLSQAQRLIAGARQRLEAVADGLAALRHRLGAAEEAPAVGAPETSAADAGAAAAPVPVDRGGS
jgi:hypothetical protein